MHAGRWHDIGKAHAVFDQTMHVCALAPAGCLAKSPCHARHRRRFFRHEPASMLAWLARHDGERSEETRLQLALMEIGLGAQGRSWAERSLKLLEELGPFRLASLETLLRLADRRASRAQQAGASPTGPMDRRRGGPWQAWPARGP